MTPGSVLVTFGRTQVLCTVSLEPDIPRWLKGQGRGWVTAEYNMLPGSSPERVRRSTTNGRSQEIQRLIGRSLRSVCDLVAMGERSIIVDCDVLQADGGTRTASICGAYLALHDACTRLVAARELAAHPLRDELAATSVGIIDAEARLDLPYVEDSVAEVDFNVVMTGSGDFVEVQGTAEGRSFSRAALDELLDLAAAGIGRIVEGQREYLAVPAPALPPLR
jgi:ribonuclease PH